MGSVQVRKLLVGFSRGVLAAAHLAQLTSCVGGWESRRVFTRGQALTSKHEEAQRAQYG